MDYKYIILDFGNVLAYPVSGHWFITDKFMELIDMNKIDQKELNVAIHSHEEILSRRAVTLEEEYKIFCDYYKSVLSDVKYKVPNSDIVKGISYDFTYNPEKCKIYDDVPSSLEKLSRDYKLLLLSDNWPCGVEIMKYYDLDKYFTKMYISSAYEALKRDGIFFDYPISDFNIKSGEALFIDDNEINLDAAVTKGLDVMIMMRDQIKDSKYPIIDNLNLEKKLVKRKKML